MNLGKPIKLLEEFKGQQFVSFYNESLVKELIKEYNTISQLIEANKHEFLAEKNKSPEERKKTVYLTTLTLT